VAPGLAAIAQRLARTVDRAFEQPALVDPGELAQRFADEAVGLGSLGAGKNGSREPAGGTVEHAQQ
jgi:hypothetical protein